MTDPQKKEDEKFNETVKRMLKTPPDPKTLPKPKPGKEDSEDRK